MGVHFLRFFLIDNLGKVKAKLNTFYETNNKHIRVHATQTVGVDLEYETATGANLRTVVAVVYASLAMMSMFNERLSSMFNERYARWNMNPPHRTCIHHVCV